MKNNNTRTRLLWVMGTVLSLVISFLISRYIFFEFHGNKQWHIAMLITALIVTGVAAIFDGRITMVSTVIGYLGGFALGLIFSTDRIDPGGGALNNWWAIWAIAFIAIIVIGVIWEVAFRVNKRHE